MLKKANKVKETKKCYLKIYLPDEGIGGISLPKITGISYPCDNTFMYSDIFQMNSIVDLIEYELLDDFVDIIYVMTHNYVLNTFDEDEIDIDDIIIDFHDVKTDKCFAGIHAFLDWDEEKDDVCVMYHLSDYNGLEDGSSCEDCLPMFEFELEDEDED